MIEAVLTALFLVWLGFSLYNLGERAGVRKEQERFRRYTEARLRAERTR